MRTNVAAGVGEAEQTLPETAVKWILQTEALALPVAAILGAMVAQATSIRPQPALDLFRGVVRSAVLMAGQLLRSGNTEPRFAAAPLNPNSVWRIR
jgi:hypothetical protein